MEGQADMIQIGEWTNDKQGRTGNFASGAIGFRSSGGEAIQFDNVVVADSLENITTPVEPRGMQKPQRGGYQNSPGQMKFPFRFVDDLLIIQGCRS